MTAALLRQPRLQRQLAALLLTALLTSVAAAHQQKESITRVLFNERTGNIEVMHRFILHDAEHAVEGLFGKGADLLGNPDDRQKFADYVYARFTISDQNGESIELTPVGHEIDGAHLWVYAEAPVPEGLTELSISHEALRDLWPSQTNLVNVERGDSVKSALFNGGSREITLRF
jgi:hypothetical protein